MRITILGRSPARPNPGEACAGYLVEEGDTRLLVDAGPGVTAQLLMRAEPQTLTAVIISHLHTDHFFDLVTLRYAYPWLSESPRKLRVILPPDSEERMDLTAQAAGFPDFFTKSFALEEHAERPFEVGGICLEPIATRHYIPTWGFRLSRVDGRGGVLGYTADAAPAPSVEQIARDADLFLCEAALRSLDEDAPEPERGHLLPSEAGEYATVGRAKRLVLTHLPVNSDGGAWAVSEAQRTFAGPVEVARPLAEYEL